MAAFLLKVGVRDTEPKFATIGGFRDKFLNFRGGNLSVSATGIFIGKHGFDRAANAALSGTVEHCELVFDDGARFRGDFLFTRLMPSGKMNGETQYKVHLESVGEVTEREAGQ